MSKAVEVTLAPDVLILGGGIQGLLLMRALRKMKLGLSVILLEDESLVAQQSGHSQGQIHLGNLYFDPSKPEGSPWSRRNFRRARHIWNTIQCERRDCFSRVPTVVCYRDRRRYETHRTWAKASSTVVPKVLSPLHAKHAFESNETVVDAHRLAEAWRREFRDFVSVTPSQGLFLRNPNIVEARLSEDSVVRFEPRWLLLAAGHGNQSLLSQAGIAVPTQYTKQGHVLAVEGILPSLNAIVSDADNTFIVTKGDRRKTWLLATTSTWKLSQGAWAREAYRRLCNLAPSIGDRSAALRWKIYSATLVNGHRDATVVMPGGRIYQEDSFCRWTLWPDRLTFAPLLARRITKQLASILRKESRTEFDFGAWAQVRRTVKVADPPWRRAMTWTEWAEAFGPFD